MTEAVTANAYRKRVAKHMADNSVLQPLGFIAFGDGGHNANLTAKIANPDATGLVHELLRKPLSAILQEDLFSVTGVGSVEKPELNGAQISEAALLDTAGQLVGLKNFAPKVKESDERYELSIKLRF